MSRIGKRPIEIPDKVSVQVSDGMLEVDGPNGSLQRDIPSSVSVSVAEDQVEVEPATNSKQDRAMWGTFASHIKNMVAGVVENFKKELTFSGIGYRANVKGDTLALEMGYSHEVELDIPDGVEVTTEDDSITVQGSNKEVVGQFAATIRSVREPEPYKGSGIKYADETIRRKEGKKAV